MTGKDIQKAILDYLGTQAAPRSEKEIQRRLENKGIFEMVSYFHSLISDLVKLQYIERLRINEIDYYKIK